ncbi:MAG TPA: glycosyltransferase family 9 protein [Rhizomicrobium sp.]|nr:glycosyltransferase family 9 protein [Rhizomicrobium sp.]
MALSVSNCILFAGDGPAGLDFIVKVASFLPETPFVFVTSDSFLAEARRVGETAGLRNLTALAHISETDCERAFAAAIPAGDPGEGRVEACLGWQRRGKPVISADDGEVRFVLERSGICLPEDAQLWAAEIRRLLRDAGYYTERSRKALENAARFSAEAQGLAISRLVAAAEGSLLVGVGGGLGNMLHTTPMIRNIARRTGRRVDVVAAEDHADSLCLMHNPDYVGAVHALRRHVLERPYDTVFLTHSFGAMRFSFNAERVIWAEDWRSYRPISEHETWYNLESAKALLGVDYDADDATGYFCGDLEYRKPYATLVGLHAGSKTGRWLVKRWPYFAELAQRLAARGVRVASFGTADEYVEGTENRTGATIEAMCEAMLECSHFVSNDSGVMNIANALGIPLLALFAPTNVEARLPLRSTSVALALEKDCSPCELKDTETFQRGQCRCMADISVDVVEAKLLDLMGESGAPERRIFAIAPSA